VSIKDKLILKCKNSPQSISIREIETLLKYYGFVLDNKGKTSGSRIRFIDSEGRKILMHNPHPNNIVCISAVKSLLSFLEEEKLI